MPHAVQLYKKYSKKSVVRIWVGPQPWFLVGGAESCPARILPASLENREIGNFKDLYLPLEKGNSICQMQLLLVLEYKIEKLVTTNFGRTKTQGENGLGQLVEGGSPFFVAGLIIWRRPPQKCLGTKQFYPLSIIS
jgi:hypothetical protein